MDLKLEKLTHDLSIVSGDIEIVTGNDEIAQRIRDRLLTFLGEWFLNLSYGVDYIGRILVKNPRTNVVSAHLRDEILKSADGKITGFSSTIKNRVMTLEYSMLINGETISDEVTQ